MKKIFFVMILFALVPLATAAKIGYVIDSPDTKTGCIDVSKGIDGKELLERMPFDTVWSDTSSFGNMLCEIDEYGTQKRGTLCEFNGNYWGFYILQNNEFQMMPVGYNSPGSCWNGDILSWGGHYCTRDKDILLWSFGDGSQSLPTYSFDDLCDNLIIDDIKIESDDKTKVSSTSKDSFKAEKGAKIEIKVDLKNKYPGDIALQDAYIAAIIDNFDDDSLEIESDEKDITGQHTKSFKVDFTLPKNPQEDEYDLEITAYATGEDGIDYEQTLYISIEIDRKTHELSFIDMTIPKEIGCEQKQTLSFTIANTGEKDEEATLFLDHDQQEIWHSAFVIDPSKQTTLQYILNSDTLSEGKNEIIARIVYSSKSVEESIAITKASCKSTQAVQSTQKSTSTIKNAAAHTMTKNAAIVAKPYEKRNDGPNLLVILTILITLAAILLIVIALKK